MKLRMLFAVIGFGLAAVIAGWLYETRFKSSIALDNLVIPDNIDYFLTGFTVRVTNQQGNPDYQISSPRLEHRPKTDISHIELPTMQIFRRAELWQIESGIGQLQHRDNRLQLQHNVILQKEGNNPLQLKTSEMLFEPDRDLVTMDTRVTLLSRHGTIVAETAVFDLSRKIYALEKARAVYQPTLRNNES
ncbi:MAG: LPS export ABC transporter periplasmic protein LptC [Pseudomonadota bacterium]